MHIYISTNQLIALHSTVQHSDATRPVVFERKFEPENVEIEILLEIISERSLSYLSDDTVLNQIGPSQGEWPPAKLGRQFTINFRHFSQKLTPIQNRWAYKKNSYQFRKLKACRSFD